MPKEKTNGKAFYIERYYPRVEENVRNTKHGTLRWDLKNN